MPGGRIKDERGRIHQIMNYENLSSHYYSSTGNVQFVCVINSAIPDGCISSSPRPPAQ